MIKKYFELLGINENSSIEEIKKAYKKKAKEYHPDINKAEDATEKFKQINEAYNKILEYKNNPFANNTFQRNNFSQNPFRRYNNLDFFEFDIFKEFFENLSSPGGEDIFSELFNIRINNKRNSFEGQNVILIVKDVSLKDIFNEKLLEISLPFNNKIIKLKIPKDYLDHSNDIILSGESLGINSTIRVRLNITNYNDFILINNRDIQYSVLLKNVVDNNVIVPTLEDKKLKIKIPENFNFKEKIRIKEKGLWYKDGNKFKRGDLYIKFIE